MTNNVTQKLKQTSHSLLMMSESEYPFEVVSWIGETQDTLTNQKLLQLTGHPLETPIEIVDLDDFFRNSAEEKEWHDEIQKQDVQKFQSLVQTLKDNLTNIKVYRLGRIDIDVYIIGQTTSGDLAGISTKVIET
ncbi:nuclease A inhibitor family protein [Nostoc sp. LEGE 06077]|uniref:nuclease A inhibitor family protein n=1 Tax=Nostoc sp. LEGE 06077 TaxID=915325 RepID=UPI001882D77F|nr:nuclease A inhibitor family protein [Nostoc sp. LEGE 06077]MBE9206648.1 nuclease A inhibitor family protein [Nostoc sp. LEGE 06077]